MNLANVIFPINWIYGQIFFCVPLVQDLVIYWNKSTKNMMYQNNTIARFLIKFGIPKLNVTSIVIIVAAEIISNVSRACRFIPPNIRQEMFSGSIIW